MLEVKQVRFYRLAKYPRGTYREKPPVWLAGQSTAAVLLMLALEGCEGGGTTGPPPVLPDMVTESEARVAINRVLQNNGLTWQNDAPFTLSFGVGDTVHLVVDSYNDSLRVGYEYVAWNDCGSDYETFTPRVTAALDSAAKAQGPYIEVIDDINRRVHSDYEQLLETSMQQFLDTLRAHGVI